MLVTLFQFIPSIMTEVCLMGLLWGQRSWFCLRGTPLCFQAPLASKSTEFKAHPKRRGAQAQEHPNFHWHRPACNIQLNDKTHHHCAGLVRRWTHGKKISAPYASFILLRCTKEIIRFLCAKKDLLCVLRFSWHILRLDTGKHYIHTRLISFGCQYPCRSKMNKTLSSGLQSLAQEIIAKKRFMRFMIMLGISMMKTNTY